jgi:murein DD-endopeptidase MepM/ murein hydrolase activator NlpD
MLLGIVFVLMMYVSSSAQQLAGISLNQNGMSYIYPPFDTDGWQLTRWAGDTTHQGDDWYAQDWARDCGQTRGKTVYASISGQVVFAGWRGDYGNTVGIYDQTSRFILRYSHLDTIAVTLGQTVVAGETKLGTVGNTGNVSGNCWQDNGAHLHLALYKNVSDPSGRPMTTTRATGNSTSFAADFRYACPIPLVRTRTNQTVYAISGNQRRPISLFVFTNQGWNFDRSRTLFNPVQIWPDWQINQYGQGNFCTPRDGTIVRGETDQTVFLIWHDQKNPISYAEFICRGMNWNEVLTIPQGEVASYPMGSELLGCSAPAGGSDLDAQAKRDMDSFARARSQFRDAIPGSYEEYESWHPDWQLRWQEYGYSGGLRTTMLHATSTHNNSQRLVGYSDPVTGFWSGWIQV